MESMTYRVALFLKGTGSLAGLLLVRWDAKRDLASPRSTTMARRRIGGRVIGSFAAVTARCG